MWGKEALGIIVCDLAVDGHDLFGYRAFGDEILGFQKTRFGPNVISARLIEAGASLKRVGRVGILIDEQLELFAARGLVFQAIRVNKADGIPRFGREIRTVGHAQNALINAQSRIRFAQIKEVQFRQIKKRRQYFLGILNAVGLLAIALEVSEVFLALQSQRPGV